MRAARLARQILRFGATGFGAVLLGVLSPMPLRAQLRVDPVFSPNMVLQADRPVAVWGTGVPGRGVVVTLPPETRRAVVASDSFWRVSFRARPSSTRPLTLVARSGTDRLKLGNLLLGDVWLCLGQSNMEFPLGQERHFPQEAARLHQPLLRLCNPTFAGKNAYAKPFSDSVARRLTPGAFYAGGWQACDSTTAPAMSAVGYFFGKEITTTGIPVGLVNLAIGGAPIETFLPAEALRQHPVFRKKIGGNWLTNDALPVWVRQRGRENLRGVTAAPADSLGPNHAFKPGFAYAAGIAPRLGLPIRGILWYQGESNAQEPARVAEYRELMRLLVTEYRARWGQTNLPVYWVQLSSIDTIGYAAQYWPWFRDEQRKLVTEIAHGGMAVSSDVGARHDVHPTDKRTVGQRLARWALHEVYGKLILPSGPLPERAIYRDGRVTVSFRYAGNGLGTADHQPLRGFSVDGQGEIPAVVREVTVELTVPRPPQFVTYGWEPYTEANLVNSAGLPASTFKLPVAIAR